METRAMTVQTFETDSVIITVPITREDTGAALQLTNATLEAVAQRRGGSAIAATVTVTDAQGGICQVSFAPETFQATSYDWQLRVTIAGEVQTVVADTIIARRSIRAAS
jgi:hypothetical protein